MKETFKAGDEVGSMLGDDVLVKSGHDQYPLMLKKHEMTITTEGKSYKAHVHPFAWHRKTGSAPIVGERPFEYPIYKRNRSTGSIVKFTALTSAEIVAEATEFASGGHKLGYKAGNFEAHTNFHSWEDCEKPPEAKELTVADIEKALGYKVKIVK